jgi:hypothetical protein
MSIEHPRHPRNAPGSFYVEHGCCTSCMAPHVEAPDLMGYDLEDHHCFFHKQPTTNAEVYRAIRAVRSSEFDCLRYAVDNPDILRRLAESGLAQNCDHPPPNATGAILRNHVTFALIGIIGESEVVDLPLLLNIAASFRSYFLAQESYSPRFTAGSLEVEDSIAKFECSWSTEQHHLTVTVGEPGAHQILISHSPRSRMSGFALSLMLDDWLRSDRHIAAVRWYTPQSWHGAKEVWQETPV